MIDPVKLLIPVSAPDAHGALSKAERSATRDPQGLENSPQARKLRDATQEFEGFLVSSWWQNMEKSLGESEDSGSPGFDTMKGLAIQTMTKGLAASGGLGIARMMFHQLAPALGHDHENSENELKIPKGD